MLFLFFLAALLSLVECKSWRSKMYDLGLYGAYPHISYASFDLVSPRAEIEEWDARCDNGDLILLTPRGRSVPTPGPMIVDAEGNLVWMESKFGEVMDMKMQAYNGEQYLTFWAGIDDGTHGRGHYYMVFPISVP
jgi:hypothetical protein